MGKNYSKTPTTLVRFSVAKGKEYWRQQLKWTSLAFFELSEKDRNYAMHEVLSLTTGRKVNAFINKQLQERQPNFWTQSVLDKLGHCVLVSYRGVSIRLLYKRTIIEHPISELCPVPDKPVLDDEDAWVYIDLVGNSARQSHAPTLERLTKMQMELDAAHKRIKAQDNIIIDLDKNAYSRALADMRDDNKAVNARLDKIEEKQSTIPTWAIQTINILKRGSTVEENKLLYFVAREISHTFGMDWIDPRNGKKHKVPKAKEETNDNSDREARQGKTKGRSEDGAHPAKRHRKIVVRSKQAGGKV